MSPEKITSHEPTSVKRDPNDQEIAEGEQTKTTTEQAKENDRKRRYNQSLGRSRNFNFLFKPLFHYKLY